MSIELDQVTKRYQGVPVVNDVSISVAEGEVLVLEYADRPGVMGRVGTLLGEAAVNIEAAQISQTTDGTDAIMLLRVDRPVDPAVLDPIGASIGARTVRLISFD